MTPIFVPAVELVVAPPLVIVLLLLGPPRGSLNGDVDVDVDALGASSGRCDYDYDRDDSRRWSIGSRPRRDRLPPPPEAGWSTLLGRSDVLGYAEAWRRGLLPAAGEDGGGAFGFGSFRGGGGGVSHGGFGGGAL